MKPATLLRAALLVAPALAAAPALAGTLSGTVMLGPAPAAGVYVSVACPDFQHVAKTPEPTPTDANGVYSVQVNSKGHCEMRVQHGTQTGQPFGVQVSADKQQHLDLHLGGNLSQTP